MASYLANHGAGFATPPLTCFLTCRSLRDFPAALAVLFREAWLFVAVFFMLCSPCDRDWIEGISSLR